MVVFFFSSRRRHTRYWRDWSSDVCSSDLGGGPGEALGQAPHALPTRCLLRRGHGRVPGRGRAPAGRGGLPAGVPGAACAPGLPGGGLRGGTVPTPRGRRDRRGTAARRGGFRRLYGGRGRGRREVGALPQRPAPAGGGDRLPRSAGRGGDVPLVGHIRSEERRGGKECRSRWSPYH